MREPYTRHRVSTLRRYYRNLSGLQRRQTMRIALRLTRRLNEFAFRRLALEATVLGLALILALSTAPAGPASRAQPSGRERCPSASGQEVVLTVPLPGKPGFPLLVNKTLWVTIQSGSPAGHGKLARVDAESGRVQRVDPLTVDPMRLTYGFGSLWVTGEGVVLRIDPRSGRVVKVIRGRRLFGPALAATSDAVWVGGADIYAKGHDDETLMRWMYKIDPLRNAVVRQVHLAPTTVLDLVGDGRSVWATGWGALVKLSASGRLLFQQRFGGSGWSMAVGPDAVWVAQPFFGTRDPRSQRPARRLLRFATSGPRRVTVVELAAPPGDVSVAGHIVWVGSAVWATGELARIDETQTTPTATGVAGGVAAARIEAFPGGVWVAERNRNELSKIC
jgi:hypothetical protein